MEEEADNKKDLNNETSNTKSKLIPYECKICGAPAFHSNYGAISCYPCKMFFRRNVPMKQKQFTCHLNGQCDINITNRHRCPPCRLEKCFANGMQVELIRCQIPRKQVESITTTDNILRKTNEELLPIKNLLQPDNSIFTINQWTFLSNLVSNYDERKCLLIAEQFLNEYNDLIAREFFQKIYQTTEEYIRLNSDFCKLSSDDRSNFLRNIIENVTCLGIVFCWNQSQIYNCKDFINICINFYGENFVNIIQRILKFIDPDIIIAKLAISLYAFSNNSSIFYLNMTTKSLDTLPIFHIQNIYADIIWKYLLCKYDYYQSIKRFINFIQCLLTTTNMVYDAQNIEIHVNDIESLVEQTELTLVLDDIECIDENE